jgi:hypothetical protein
VYGSNQSELAWTVIPLRTVFVLCLVTTRTIKAVQQAVPSAEALLVTIIGHQWWWEMRYPALGIVTANAWHVPVSAQTQPMPTFLKLQSVDVAHIPSLKAKELSKLPREEAGVWSSGKDRIPRIPLSALRPGEAPGGHELQVVAVLAVRRVYSEVCNWLSSIQTKTRRTR